MTRTWRVLVPIFLGSLACIAGCSGSHSLVIVSLPILQTPSGQTYSYGLVLESVSGTPGFQVAAGPPGMTVSAAGLVEWSPVYGDLGDHAVTVSVTDDTTTATQQWTLRVHQDIDLGVTLSPRGHTQSSGNQDFTDHYSGHAAWGKVIAFHGSWRDTVMSAGTIPLLAASAMTAAQTFGFTPVIGFGWSDGDGNPDLTSQSALGINSWANLETRNEFRQMVTDFASAKQPPYLFLGNETNSYALTHTAQEWADWISEFEECYDAIKSVSPGTMVYTTFQLEKMKGLGIYNGWSNSPQWQLIADHALGGKIDAIGFTSYPYFEFTDPTMIPSGYYDEISTYWTGPVCFSEIGWCAQATPPYAGSEAQQQGFIGTFFDLTQNLNLASVVWLFLHDWDQQGTVPAFANIGLRENDGNDRPADAAWQAEVLRRQK